MEEPKKKITAKPRSKAPVDSADETSGKPKGTSAAKAPRVRKTKEKEVVAASATVAAAEERPTVVGSSSIFALGRRKTAIARVRLGKNGVGTISVNKRPFDQYFGTYELRNIITAPLKMVGQESALNVEASVNGGGSRGQAEAIRLGVCRALVVLNPTYRKTLKKLGYLTRDPRAKERKKFGLKRARRAPQWSKR